MKALRCTNVYKVFGKDPDRAVDHLKAGGSHDELPDDVTVAVDNVSLEIEEGEIFVVMGLSGSGKSTLLRTLNGLGPASSGSVHIGDQEITKMTLKQIRRLREERLSMVFQHFGLLPHRTVLENAAYPLEIQKVDRQEREARAMEALKTTGLEGREGAYPDELSGGMQQRVGLARALTADADILLMDEAFSALDPLIRRDMQDLLLQIQAQQRRTIVFITHDLNEAMYVGDRIAVMRDGQVVQIGTAEEILTSPANDYIARFIQDVDRTRVITASAMMRQPGTRIFSGDGPRAVLQKLEKWDEPAGWVVDSGTHKLHGMIHTDDVVRAIRDNPNLTRIDDLLRKNFAAVGPDDSMAEVITLASGTPITIPVVDADGRLAGIIPRIAVLVALATASNGAENSGTDDALTREQTEEAL